MVGPIRVLDSPGSALAASDPLGMLAELGGPAAIRVPGANGDRCRVAITLLHGNEPSGARAAHRLLAAAPRPALDLWIVVGAVEAALAGAGFAHRFLPGRRDLNRVFGAGDLAGTGGPDVGFARALLAFLERLPPIEGLVDFHNNSGRNPPYAIATRLGDAQLDLAALFTARVIHTDLRLGTLIEAIEDRIPSVSVEAGRSGDPAADETAYRGLLELATRPELAGDRDALEIFGDPVRVELAPGATVAFAAARPATPVADLVLSDEIDRHNFAVVRAGTELGWVEPGTLPLAVHGSARQDLAAELFTTAGASLRARVDLVPIMMTLDPVVARQDCLFYVVRSRRVVPAQRKTPR